MSDPNQLIPQGIENIGPRRIPRRDKRTDQSNQQSDPEAEQP